MALPEGYAISPLTGKKGADGTSAKFIEIEAPNGLVFKNGSLNSLTLNAIAIGFTPSSYVWKKNGTVISGQTDASLTVAKADVTSSATYSVEADGCKDYVTLIAVSDGANGTSPYACSLSNENFSIATGTDLKPLSVPTGGYSCKFTAYKGSTQLSPIAPSAAIASGKFKISTPSSAGGITVAQDTNGTLTFTPSISTAITENQTFSVTVIYDNGSTETKVITISASKTGAKGDKGSTPPVYTCELSMSSIGSAVTLNVYKDGIKVTGTLYYSDFYGTGTNAATTAGVAKQSFSNGSATINAVASATKHLVKIYSDADATDLLCTGFVSYGSTGSGGQNSVSYWLITDASSINVDTEGNFTPASITLTAKSKTGNGSPANYSGRFKIEVSTNGSTYTTKYTSSANEATKTYTIPASTKSVRCSLYLAGGTSMLLDQDIITVNTDGEKGDKGDTGNTGTKTFFSDYARTWTNTNWNTYKTAGYATTWNNSTVEGMRVGDVFVITATLSEQGNITGTVYAQITSVPSAKTDGYYKIPCTTLYGMVGQRGQTGATGTRGNLTFVGTEIYNIRASAVAYTLTTASTGITDTNMNILVGDRYINSLTGDVWKCTTAGTASTAKWTYEGRQAKDSDSSNQFRFFGDGTRTKYNSGGAGISQTEVTGEGPFGGNTSLLKITRPANAASNGRVTPYSRVIKLESGVSYRYACYAKKTNNGFINYFGCRGWQNVSETVKNAQILTLAGAETNAGYFCSSANFGTVGRWYLVIGYVTANGVTTAPANDAGVYDMVTKQKVAKCINYQFKNITEYTHDGTLIEYSANSSTPTAENTTYVYDIRFDKLDGTEPTLNELLNNDTSAKGNGTWASGTNYIIGDIVFYSTDGCSYICKASHTSSSSIVPTNTTYWDKIADKGEKGDRGFSSRTIAFRINYSAFSTANDGEVYVCGYNANGAESDTYGYVIINGTTYYAKGMLNSNCAMNGYMAIQKSGATSSGSPAAPVYVFEDGSNTWYQVANSLTSPVKSAISSKADWIVLAKVHSQTSEGKISLEPMTPCLLSDINSVIEMKYEGIVAAVTNYTSAQITPYKITGSNGSFSKTALTARYVERGALVLNTNAVTPTSSTAQARMMLFDGTTWTEISSNDARYNDAILLCAGALPSLAGYYYTLGLATPNICGTYIDTLTTNRAFINEAMINLIRAYDINFKNSVSSYKDSGYVAGDLAISMGKNPKNEEETDNNFLIQSFVTALNKSSSDSMQIEQWKKVFYTQYNKDERTVDFFLNGLINAIYGIKTYQPIYAGSDILEQDYSADHVGEISYNTDVASYTFIRRKNEIYAFQCFINGSNHSNDKLYISVAAVPQDGLSYYLSFSSKLQVSLQNADIQKAVCCNDKIYLQIDSPTTKLLEYNPDTNTTRSIITASGSGITESKVENLMLFENNALLYTNGNSRVNRIKISTSTTDVTIYNVYGTRMYKIGLNKYILFHNHYEMTMYNTELKDSKALGYKNFTNSLVYEDGVSIGSIYNLLGDDIFNIGATDDKIIISGKKTNSTSIDYYILCSSDFGNTFNISLKYTKQVPTPSGTLVPDFLFRNIYFDNGLILLNGDKSFIYSIDNGKTFIPYSTSGLNGNYLGESFVIETPECKDIIVPVAVEYSPGSTNTRLNLLKIRSRNVSKPYRIRRGRPAEPLEGDFWIDQ